MKKIIYSLLAAVLVCSAPAQEVLAEEPPVQSGGIVISELQTAGATDATEEFVELYNSSEEPVDVTGWILQYRSASGTSSQTWSSSSTKATLGCVAGSPNECRLLINAHERIVLVHTIANIAGALPMNGGFSGIGGQIRLLQPDTIPVVHDFIGYGTAADFETAAAAAPTAGKSLKRVVSADGVMQDTHNNSLDFIANCGNPSPGQNDTSPLPLGTGCTTPLPNNPDDPPPDDPEPTQPQDTLTYLPVQITEVFPDPVTPAQDSNDEFIELYNPYDATISLEGYQLQTGSGFRYHYTLGAIPLGPHRYLVIPSAVSHVSLANSGSGVRLIDPLGAVVAEAPDYGTAKPGQSWIQHEGVWQWTTSPTPGSNNILSVPPPPPAKTTAQKTPKKKVAVAKKPTPPKTTKAPSAPKAAPISPPEVIASATKAHEPPYWIIIPLALGIVGYGIYEYRHALVKVWKKFKKPFTKTQSKTDQEQN